MNLQCNDIQKLLDEYINKKISNKKKKMVREHIESCDGCKAELKKEQEIIKIIGTIPQLSCPDRIVKRIENQTYNKYKEKNIISNLFNWIFINKLRPITIGLAAAVIIIAILNPFLPQNNIQKENKENIYTTAEIQKAKKEAELSLSYIGHIINENNKKAVNNVLMDRFPKIIKQSLKNSINILGGE